MWFIIFLAFEVVQKDHLWPTISVECYPEMICPGDTLYIKIVATNPHKNAILVPEDFSYTNQGDNAGLRIKFMEPDIPLLFEERHNFEWSSFLSYQEIMPSNWSCIGLLSISIPPLEDLHQLEWEKLIQKSAFDKYKVTLEANINTSQNQENSCGIQNKNIKVTQKFFLKPRIVREMVMIEQWYQQTPIVFFLVIKENRLRKTPNGELFQSNDPCHILSCDPWLFIRLGNRYPGPPNAPSTWQGWLELEESLTPSTMRDEIRLTRIIIQYCDTKDSKVLDELREWFIGMNEIQRSCMAKSIQDRARNSYGTDLLDPYCDIYHIIREYDISAKTEWEIEHLKNLKLLE